MMSGNRPTQLKQKTQFMETNHSSYENVYLNLNEIKYSFMNTVEYKMTMDYVYITLQLSWNVSAC